jgi:CRP-like cAMP-binding protein
VLNQRVFEGCSGEFKRQILRGMRVFEFEFKGKETWYDEDLGQICTLDMLDDDVLPPLQPSLVGVTLEPSEYICRSGDYDARLVVVLEGTVEKLVGPTHGGGVLVRRLERGECEGLSEFLGVGIEQRTSHLRAGPDGARVRYVGRPTLLKVLSQTQPDDEEVPLWPLEQEYFAKLALDRIDSLSHKEASRLLQWPPAGKAEVAAAATAPAKEEEDEVAGAETLLEGLEGMDINGPPVDLTLIKGQTLFQTPNALGMTTAGPLPEGIEERYYFDGQCVLRSGVLADSCVLVLRGEVSAVVPDGCQGQCLPRINKPHSGGSWLCGNKPGVDYKQPQRRLSRQVSYARGMTPQALDPEDDFDEHAIDADVAALLREKNAAKNNEVVFVALIDPKKIKKAQRVLHDAAAAGDLDLSNQRTSDWRWPLDDRRSLTVVDLLDGAKMLSQRGQEKAIEIRAIHDPPPPPPLPEPQAILGSGSILGELSLCGVPVVFAGDVVARGPVVVAVLHRQVLLEAVRDLPERDYFVPRGLTKKERKRVLSEPVASKTEAAQDERPAHLGPITGPPKHATMEELDAAATGTGKLAPRGTAVADALEYVLLNAIRACNFLWDLIHDAPPRLLEALINSFETRWLLPNEVVVVDEEPDADFLFIVIHGTFVVTLENAEIDRISQGAVQGFAQVLNLNDWTRTVTVDPLQRGEAMIQILRKDSIVEVLSGHPGPKYRLLAVKETLEEAKGADWRILQQIPAFGNAAGKPFLSRVLKDADVRLFCPGDFLATAGELGGSMYMVLAGTCRSEQPQTLFYVELHRGDWCFQNNILGVEATRAHDLVAVTHVMVLVLFRHTLLNALVAFPEARESVLENEVWRAGDSCPQLAGLNVFEGVPGAVVARMEQEARPLYFRAGSCILKRGGVVKDDALLFVIRGKAKVAIMGMAIRTLNVGDTIGMHRFLELPADPDDRELRVENCTDVVAVEPCDIIAVQRRTMQVALKDDRYEEALGKYKQAASVLGGGAILDAFGFPVGGVKARLATDCIETSEVFRVCSKSFVDQIPTLLEERAFWPGERLYSQFDEGDFMFFIQAGRVRLEVLGRKEHEVADAGATLGDLACLGQTATQNETAIAETHVWARALHRRLLRRALASFPEEERRLTGAAQQLGAAGLFDEE